MYEAYELVLFRKKERQMRQNDKIRRVVFSLRPLLPFQAWGFE